MAHQTRSKAAVAKASMRRIVQPLVAGNNLITHNLGAIPEAGDEVFYYEVRNLTTGSVINTRLISSTANDFILFVAVATPPVRIIVHVRTA